MNFLKKIFDGKSPEEEHPEHSLEYALKARGTNKRNYIFDYKKSSTCNHGSLRSLIVGSQLYRCEDCNYVFSFVAAWQQPMHHAMMQGLEISQSFVKEFGIDAALEVVHRDLGQIDGTPQKPVIPDGMTLEDTWRVFDQINVLTEDKGAGELRELYDEVWERPSQARKAHIDALRAGMFKDRKALEEKKRAQVKGEEAEPGGVGELPEGKDSDTRDKMPSV